MSAGFRSPLWWLGISVPSIAIEEELSQSRSALGGMFGLLLSQAALGGVVGTERSQAALGGHRGKLQ